jgi:hypothetical protein
VVATELDRSACLDGGPLGRIELKAQEVHRRGLFLVLTVEILIGDGIHPSLALDLDEQAILHANQTP